MARLYIWLVAAHTHVVTWSGADAVVLLQLRRLECQDGDVRLSGTRPELFYNHSWTPICGHFFWSNHDGATTLCQQLGYDSGRVALAPEALPVDAVQVGKCGPGERLDRCTQGHNSRDLSAWCLAGNYNSLEVNCSTGPKPVTSTGVMPLTSSCRDVAPLHRWGEISANTSQAPLVVPRPLPGPDGATSPAQDIERRETSSATQKWDRKEQSSQVSQKMPSSEPQVPKSPFDREAGTLPGEVVVQGLGNGPGSSATDAWSSQSGVGGSPGIPAVNQQGGDVQDVAEASGTSTSRAIARGQPGTTGIVSPVSPSGPFRTLQNVGGELSAQNAAASAQRTAAPLDDRAYQGVSPQDRAFQRSPQDHGSVAQTIEQGSEAEGEPTTESKTVSRAVEAARGQANDAKRDTTNATLAEKIPQRGVGEIASSDSGNTTQANVAVRSLDVGSELANATVEAEIAQGSGVNAEIASADATRGTLTNNPVKDHNESVGNTTDARTEPSVHETSQDNSTSTRTVVNPLLPSTTDEHAEAVDGRKAGTMAAEKTGRAPAIAPTSAQRSVQGADRIAKGAQEGDVDPAALADAPESSAGSDVRPDGRQGPDPVPRKISTKENATGEAKRCEALAAEVQWIATTAEPRCLVLDDNGDWGVASWIEPAALAQYEVRCEDTCCADLEEVVLNCCGVPVAPTALRCGIPPSGASYVSVQVPGIIAAPVESQCAFANLQLRCPT